MGTMTIVSETDREIVHKALMLLSAVHPAPEKILDPGAGKGVWGDEARRIWPRARICGVEIRDGVYGPGGPYTHFLVGDFLNGTREKVVDFFGGPADMVVGTPPHVYRPKNAQAEEFLRVALDLLRDEGYLLFLLPLEFVGGKFRALELLRANPPLKILPLKERDEAVFVWSKGWRGPTFMEFGRL